MSNQSSETDESNLDSPTDPHTSTSLLYSLRNEKSLSFDSIDTTGRLLDNLGLSNEDEILLKQALNEKASANEQENDLLPSDTTAANSRNGPSHAATLPASQFRSLNGELGKKESSVLNQITTNFKSGAMSSKAIKHFSTASRYSYFVEEDHEFDEWLNSSPIIMDSDNENVFTNINNVSSPATVSTIVTPNTANTSITNNSSSKHSLLNHNNINMKKRFPATDMNHNGLHYKNQNFYNGLAPQMHHQLNVGMGKHHNLYHHQKQNFNPQHNAYSPYNFPNHGNSQYNTNINRGINNFERYRFTEQQIATRTNVRYKHNRLTGHKQAPKLINNNLSQNNPESSHNNIQINGPNHFNYTPSKKPNHLYINSPIQNKVQTPTQVKFSNQNGSKNLNIISLQNQNLSPSQTKVSMAGIQRSMLNTTTPNQTTFDSSITGNIVSSNDKNDSSKPTDQDDIQLSSNEILEVLTPEKIRTPKKMQSTLSQDTSIDPPVFNKHSPSPFKKGHKKKTSFSLKNLFSTPKSAKYNSSPKKDNQEKSKSNKSSRVASSASSPKKIFKEDVSSQNIGKQYLFPADDKALKIQGDENLLNPFSNPKIRSHHIRSKSEISDRSVSNPLDYIQNKKYYNKTTDSLNPPHANSSINLHKIQSYDAKGHERGLSLDSTKSAVSQSLKIFNKSLMIDKSPKSTTPNKSAKSSTSNLENSPQITNSNDNLSTPSLISLSKQSTPIQVIPNDATASTHQQQQLLKEQKLHEQVDLAITMRDEGKFVESAAILRDACLAGDRTAFLLYGLSLRYGYGVEKDYEQSFKFIFAATSITSEKEEIFNLTLNPFKLETDLEDVSNNGSNPIIPALYECGIAYLKDYGITDSANHETKGLKYLEKAASMGHVDALCLCGILWSKSSPTRKKDMCRAAAWFRIAERRGAHLIGSSWIHKEKYFPN